MGRALERDESGASLIEVLVAGGLLATVLGVVLGALSSVQSTVIGEEIRLQNLDEARVLMNTVTRDVRTATAIRSDGSPFLIADGNRMRFYANLDTTGPPKLVELYIDASRPAVPLLIQTVTPPDPDTSPPTYLTQPPQVRVVGRFVTNNPLTPMFQYHDGAGDVIARWRPLTAQEAMEVRTITVTLSIRKANARGAPSTVLANRVRLPNVYYNPPASPDGGDED